MIVFHSISTLVVLILAAGFLLRRRRTVHVGLMVAAFGLDVALVGAIEISRGAVQKATSSPPPLLLFHVSVSIMTLVSYVAMALLGSRVLAGQDGLRAWHRRIGWLFGTSRTANYITSWMI